jgi:hypothetical protein
LGLMEREGATGLFGTTENFHFSLV